MSYSIDSELDRFLAFPAEAGANLEVEQLCDYGYLVRPKNPPSKAAPKQKRVALTLMGITHGNEFAGLAVLNEVLALVSSGR